MKSVIRKGDRNNATSRPPARLSWPASLKESSSRCKRPRHELQDSELWVNRFAPSKSADLCVAPKKVKECRSWLEQATKSPNSHKLLVLVGAAGSGKSTMARLLARELRMDVHSWNESFVAREPGHILDQVVSVERTSALDSFEEFLAHCGAGFSSLQFSSHSSSQHPRNNTRSFILLEDLPNLHGLDMALRFRNIISHHLRTSQVPTIIVFSDVSEGTHRPADLERIVDPNDLYSQSTLICQIHPVTKPKMKKILEAIAHRQCFLLAASLSEELHLRSGGDLRHAIMTLQVHFSGSKQSSKGCDVVQHNDRDQKLSTFHALGKLLYAKRERSEHGRECLAFDPEVIILQSDLGVGGSLYFLGYHSAEFFTDIDDIGAAYALFSDAALLLDHQDAAHDTDALFQDQCASSIAGRAVASSNHHPAPNRFRQFSTPKVFEVMRKRRQNDTLLSELAQRLSISHISPSTAAGGSHAFVTELLPAMRIISPKVVNPSVESFYSIAGESTGVQAKYAGPSKETAMLEVQAKILSEDDIEDFDDDEESTMNQKSTNLAPPAADFFSLSQKENNPRSNAYRNSAVRDKHKGKASPEVIVID